MYLSFYDTLLRVYRGNMCEAKAHEVSCILRAGDKEIFVETTRGESVGGGEEHLKLHE